MIANLALLSVEELSEQLSRLKLNHQIIDILKENKINGRLFTSLTEEHCKRMGLRYGHWIALENILRNATQESPLQTLGVSQAPQIQFGSSASVLGAGKKPVEKLTPSELGVFLRGNSGLSESAITLLVESEFSGKSFLELNREQMSKMGLKLGSISTILMLIQELKLQSGGLQKEDHLKTPQALIEAPQTKKRKREVKEVVALPPQEIPPQGRLQLPEGTMEKWVRLIQSGELKEADSDVRMQFPALSLRNALCPFPNCSFTCSPRHSVDFLNHVLSLHVQYKRFSCDVCPVSVATATQLRRHFREYHKLEKSELITKMHNITRKVEEDLASLRSTQLQDSVAIPLFNEEGDGLTQVQDLPWYPDSDELTQGEQPLDQLGPDVGTNGTLITIMFATNKDFSRPQIVNFRSQNHPHLPVITQKADVYDNQKVFVPFLQQQSLEKIRMAVFEVNVVGIHHTPLKFIWVGPSTVEALEYVRKRFPPNLSGSEEDEDYNDYARKIKKLTPEERNTLVHHYTFLGSQFALETLQDKF